jgi:putative ABC transport system permease protein
MGKDISGVPDLLTFISAVVVVAAFPLIGVIAAMVAHERQREIGILRSMGAKKKSIIFLVMAESLSLAAIGGVAGVLASFIGITLLSATGVLESALQVSVRFPTPAEIGLIAGFAILIVIAIGTLAALYPAYRSSTMNPYEAIRREGG